MVHESTLKIFHQAMGNFCSLIDYVYVKDTRIIIFFLSIRTSKTHERKREGRAWARHDTTQKAIMEGWKRYVYLFWGSYSENRFNLL